MDHFYSTTLYVHVFQLGEKSNPLSINQECVKAAVSDKQIKNPECV